MDREDMFSACLADALTMLSATDTSTACIVLEENLLSYLSCNISVDSLSPKSTASISRLTVISADSEGDFVEILERVDRLKPSLLFVCGLETLRSVPQSFFRFAILSELDLPVTVVTDLSEQSACDLERYTRFVQ